MDLLFQSVEEAPHLLTVSVPSSHNYEEWDPVATLDAKERRLHIFRGTRTTGALLASAVAKALHLSLTVQYQQETTAA